MRFGLCAILLAAVFSSETASAQRPRYPRVYGATGRPYGPTQAHYQYERRYGRPWHGYGGQTYSRRGGSRVFFSAPRSFSAIDYYYGPAGLPFSYYGPAVSYGYPFVGGGVVGPPGFYNYGPVYSYTPMAPQAIQAYPQWIGPNPFNNDVLRRAQLENDLRWKLPVQVKPSTVTVRKPAKSTPAARLKSIKAQAAGDRYMEQQKFHSAYERYRVAFQAAPDRAAPYFRTGFALTAMRRFSESVKYFKRGLQLDPKWPTNGESLGKVFGRKNVIVKTGVLGDATRWARKDIRDPDRLFVMGILLHFDNQTDKSPLLFEAAWRLAGGGDHLKPFLKQQPAKVVAKGRTISPKVFEVKPQGGRKPGANLEPPKPPVPGLGDGAEKPPQALVPPLPKP